MNRGFVYLISLIFLAGFTCCKNQGEKKDVITIFHAGSLSLPLKKMADQFEQEHPNCKIFLEASGSVTAIRKVTDLNRHCDILALADADLIDEWLIPDWSDWNLYFASNELALIYRDDSKYARDISESNWFEIISMPEVAYGRSDPNSDPCGYRTEMCLRLANLYYPKGVDYQFILDKDQTFIRPKASDLLALLETKTLDYMFGYTSVGYQHGFKVLHFPDSINLSQPELADFYAREAAFINGKVPGEKILLPAKPMIYGICLLKESANEKLALDFIQFVVHKDKGQKILRSVGQKVIPPVFSSKSSSTPKLIDQ